MKRWFYRWFLRDHHRQLLKAIDGPFDAALSQELDALDSLREIMEIRDNGKSAM